MLDDAGKRKLSWWLYAVVTFGAVVPILGIYLLKISEINVAWMSFLGVISAALLMSWAAEASQVSISQGLAVAIVAILQVLPEFMVEGVIAYKGDASLITANLTGSNRLLMGVGWSFVFFISAFGNKNEDRWRIRMRPEAIIEIISLIIASAYYIIILIKGTISWHDTIVLGPMFFLYLYALYRLPSESEEELKHLPFFTKTLVFLHPKKYRTLLIVFFFIVSGLTMIFVAEPFLHGMEVLAAAWGISTFVFVQWIAPFLTEMPEKISAFYWASQPKTAHMGLLNLVSSKVNQWTILVAIVPVVYGLSPHGGGAVPLDGHQKEEILLSMVMCIYGAITLLKGYFNLENALILFILWFLQFLFPGRFHGVTGPHFIFPYWLFHSMRGLTTIGFTLAAILEIIRYHKDFRIIEKLAITAKMVLDKELEHE